MQLEDHAAAHLVNGGYPDGVASDEADLVAKALAVQLDVRDAEAIAGAVKRAVDAFKGIDALINNASAIHLAGTLETPMKRYDLMQDVNARGTFLCTQACLPHMKARGAGSVVALSGVTAGLLMNAGWSIPDRSSTQMAAGTPKKKRLKYANLLPGDIILFAPNGRDSKAADVYHAGLYLGKGWMIHSSGSRAGVSITSVGPGSWWHDQIIWGRRVIPKETAAS